MLLRLFYLGFCTRVGHLHTRTRHSFCVGSFDYNVDTLTNLKSNLSQTYNSKEICEKKERSKNGIKVLKTPKLRNPLQNHV